MALPRQPKSPLGLSPLPDPTTSLASPGLPPLPQLRVQMPTLRPISISVPQTKPPPVEAPQLAPMQMPAPPLPKVMLPQQINPLGSLLSQWIIYQAAPGLAQGLGITQALGITQVPLQTTASNSSLGQANAGKSAPQTANQESAMTRKEAAVPKLKLTELLHPERYFVPSLQGAVKFAQGMLEPWPNVTPADVQAVYDQYVKDGSDPQADPATFFQTVRGELGALQEKRHPSSGETAPASWAVSPDVATQRPASKAATPGATQDWTPLETSYYADRYPGDVGAYASNLKPSNDAVENAWAHVPEGRGSGIGPVSGGPQRAPKPLGTVFGNLTGNMMGGALAGGTLARPLKSRGVTTKKGMLAGAVLGALGGYEAENGQQPGLTFAQQVMSNASLLAIPAEIASRFRGKRLGPGLGRAAVIGAGAAAIENLVPGGGAVGQAFSRLQAPLQWYQENVAQPIAKLPDEFNYANHPSLFNQEAFYQEAANFATQEGRPVPDAQLVEHTRQQMLESYFPHGRPPDLTTDLVADYQKLRDYGKQVRAAQTPVEQLTEDLTNPAWYAGFGVVGKAFEALGGMLGVSRTVGEVAGATPAVAAGMAESQPRTSPRPIGPSYPSNSGPPTSPWPPQPPPMGGDGATGP